MVELALLNKSVFWEAQLVCTDYVDGSFCLHIVLKYVYCNQRTILYE